MSAEPDVARLIEQRPETCPWAWCGTNVPGQDLCDRCVLRSERDALATALREREQQLREKDDENKELRRLLDEVGLDRAGIAGELSAVEQQLREAREALAGIAFNAESWHGDDAAKGRALAVIAGWARDPSSVPAALGEGAKG